MRSNKNSSIHTVCSVVILLFALLYAPAGISIGANTNVEITQTATITVNTLSSATATVSFENLTKDVWGAFPGIEVQYTAITFCNFQDQLVLIVGDKTYLPSAYENKPPSDWDKKCPMKMKSVFNLQKVIADNFLNDLTSPCTSIYDQSIANFNATGKTGAEAAKTFTTNVAIKILQATTGNKSPIIDSKPVTLTYFCSFNQPSTPSQACKPHFINSSGACVECSASQIVKDNKCAGCGDGLIPNENYNECVSCKDGLVPNQEKTKCINNLACSGATQIISDGKCVTLLGKIKCEQPMQTSGEYEPEPSYKNYQPFTFNRTFTGTLLQINEQQKSIHCKTEYGLEYDISCPSGTSSAVKYSTGLACLK